MARKLTNAQRAAARYARARRGELGLSQRELAKRAQVSERAIQNFEAGITWPNTDTLARLERLGLELVVGHLTEYAARHREQDVSTIDADIAAILESNLHPDLKLRLVDQLRAIAVERVRDEAEDIESRLAELGGLPGEDKAGRESA